MKIKLVNPHSGKELTDAHDELRDEDGNSFKKVKGVYRIVPESNYAENFGFQWNSFAGTQIDSVSNLVLSRERFFAEAGWTAGDLDGEAVLEVGSGAGRFTQVVLQHTKAALYSVDYSAAVEANLSNNGHHGARLQLFQASIYELPFAAGSFDKVFCFGVLQHTPDFEASVRALIQQARPDGEIAVDFYPIKGWWTKVNAKYLLRPFTRRMPHDRLLRLIESNVDWLIATHLFLHRIKLGHFTRFLPVCNIKESFPSTLSKEQLREWTVLDTFDQYSPEYDHPQRITDVAAMFERNGASVTFAGFVPYGSGMQAAVVRARRKES